MCISSHVSLLVLIAIHFKKVLKEFLYKQVKSILATTVKNDKLLYEKQVAKTFFKIFLNTYLYFIKVIFDTACPLIEHQP